MTIVDKRDFTGIKISQKKNSGKKGGAKTLFLTDGGREKLSMNEGER